EFGMSGMKAIAVGIGLLLAIMTSASAATTKQGAAAAKPAQASGNATVYFLRPRGLMIPTSPDIKLDGKVVGELGMGNYFVLNVPRGHHTIAVQGGFDGGYESDLDAEAGKTYYVEIGPRGPNDAPGTQLIGRLMSGTTFGERMPGRGFMSAFCFF